jgi:hypothetical protein
LITEEIGVIVEEGFGKYLLSKLRVELEGEVKCVMGSG